MNIETIKTIDIQGRGWLDKVNGNTYHSLQITLDFSMDTERTIFAPFKYKSSLEQYASEILKKENIVDADTKIPTIKQPS